MMNPFKSLVMLIFQNSDMRRWISPRTVIPDKRYRSRPEQFDAECNSDGCAERMPPLWSCRYRLTPTLVILGEPLVTQGAGRVKLAAGPVEKMSTSVFDGGSVGRTADDGAREDVTVFEVGVGVGAAVAAGVVSTVGVRCG